MRFVAMFAFVVVAGICSASEFDDRLASATSYLASPQAAVYVKWLDANLGPRITPVLRKCFDSVDEASKTGFVFVADIDSRGKLINAATSPSTNIGQCVVQRFEAESFEIPPPLEGSRILFPVVIDMGAHIP